MASWLANPWKGPLRIYSFLMDLGQSEIDKISVGGEINILDSTGQLSN